DNLCLRAEITNVSARAHGWDSMFAVFAYWQLSADDSPFLFDSTSVGQEIQQNKESLSRARFVRIEPGEKLSKVCFLTRPFRTFTWRPIDMAVPGARPEEVRHPWLFQGYEQLEMYVVPKNVKKLKI